MARGNARSMRLRGGMHRGPPRLASIRAASSAPCRASVSSPTALRRIPPADAYTFLQNVSVAGAHLQARVVSGPVSRGPATVDKGQPSPRMARCWRASGRLPSPAGCTRPDRLVRRVPARLSLSGALHDRPAWPVNRSPTHGRRHPVLARLVVAVGARRAEPMSGRPKTAAGVPASSCPACGVRFVCGAVAGLESCWCMEKPSGTFVPEAGAHCYCPTCLAERVKVSPDPSFPAT